MINFCNNRNFNDGINYFIMQSNENVEKFLDIYFQLDEVSGKIILNNLGLSKEDFTETDWKKVSRYL